MPGDPVYGFRISEEVASDAHNPNFTLVWKGFVDFTSSHGIPHVVNAAGPIKKGFWSILTLACVAGMLYNIVSIILLYLQYNVAVKVNMTQNRELEFPAVTVCNTNPVKGSMLHKSQKLEDLINSWDVRHKQRRKRHTAGHLVDGYARIGLMNTNTEDVIAEGSVRNEYVDQSLDDVKLDPVVFGHDTYKPGGSTYTGHSDTFIRHYEASNSIKNEHKRVKRAETGCGVDMSELKWTTHVDVRANEDVLFTNLPEPTHIEDCYNLCQSETVVICNYFTVGPYVDPGRYFCVGFNGQPVEKNMTDMGPDWYGEVRCSQAPSCNMNRPVVAHSDTTCFKDALNGNWKAAYKCPYGMGWLSDYCIDSITVACPCHIGVWETITDECVEGWCPMDPDAYTDTTFTPSTGPWPLGITVNYQCDWPFLQIDGDNDRTCSCGQAWTSFTPPVCLDTCTDLSNFGVRGYGRDINDASSLGASTGYATFADCKAYCISTSGGASKCLSYQWYPNGDCVRFKQVAIVDVGLIIDVDAIYGEPCDCSAGAPVVANSAHQCISDPSGQWSLNYTCSAGYAFSDLTRSRIATCPCGTTTWSSITDTCTVVPCSNPPTVTDTSISPAGPYQLDDVATYQCNAPLIQLGGETTKTCIVDGTAIWSGVDIICGPDANAVQPTTTEPPETTTEAPVTTTEPQATTTEPPVTTTEPPATTTEPPPTTTEPPPTTNEPPATTTEPPETTTEPQATTTETPETTTELPATTTEPQATTTETPETTTELPATTTETPVTTTESQETTTQPILTTTEPYETSTHIPDSTTEPIKTTEIPETSTNLKQTTTESPVTPTESPVTTTEPFETTTETPATTSEPTTTTPTEQPTSSLERTSETPIHTITSEQPTSITVDVETTSISSVDPTTVSSTLSTTLTSTSTVRPTLASTQPQPDTIYPDRKPYREDFMQEEDIMTILADLDFETKKSLGYTYDDMILDCQYDGTPCGQKDFSYFFDTIHGSCHVFNAGWWWNSSRTYHASKKTGRRYGLKLEVNIQQYEYVKHVEDSAGAVVVVHPRLRMPFPEDEGLFALTGRVTSIGMKKVQISRLDKPYGEGCKDQTVADFERNVYEEHYPVKYSTLACFKTCYQKTVIERCKCADPQYPIRGIAFSVEEASACDVRNVTQEDCRYGTLLDYINGRVECDCPNPCHDTAFLFQVSQAKWPSKAYAKNLIKRYKHIIPELDSINNTKVYKDNLLKVEVFFEEFNYELIEERPAYTFVSFISDMGGLFGLWLGCSILSLFEFVELFMDLVGLAVLRCRNGKNKQYPTTRGFKKSDKIIQSSRNNFEFDDGKTPSTSGSSTQTTSTSGSSTRTATEQLEDVGNQSDSAYTDDSDFSDTDFPPPKFINSDSPEPPCTNRDKEPHFALQSGEYGRHRLNFV